MATKNSEKLLIARSTLHSQLVESLREMIVEIRLSPGDRVDEKALCDAFGVSRTPLREALKVLASEGLVELLPNRSPRITSITRENVGDLFEVISWLDFHGAKVAAENVTPKDVKRLQGIHERMVVYYKAKERIKYFRLNADFHLSIINLAGNSVLSSTYANLMAQAQRARYVAIQSQAHWDRGVKEHEQIIAALADRDSELSSRLLLEHVKETGRRVGASIEQEGAA